jgi:hypothetical protein
METLLMLEKELNESSPIDKEITNDFVKVRYEHNNFVTYDWNSNKTNHNFNMDSYCACYRAMYYKREKSKNILPNTYQICLNEIQDGHTWFILDDSGRVQSFIKIIRWQNKTHIDNIYSSNDALKEKCLEFAIFIAQTNNSETLSMLAYDDDDAKQDMLTMFGYMNSKYGFKVVDDSSKSSESLIYSFEELIDKDQIKRTGKYTYNNKKRVGGRRRFKCLDCGQRFHEFMQLYHHAEKFHKDLIGDEDVYRYLYEKRNPGPYICPICNKNPREWNDKTHKYRRICRSPECIKKAREKYSKNMKRVYGTDNLLTDPARQEEMLKNRSISGIYTFEDGVKISYVGEYEHDFIMHCVDKLGYGSMDVINCPSKLYLNYYDPYTQKNRFYMPDFYIPKYNLVIEIKDGSKFPRDSKAKAKLKEAAVIKANKFNYVKIVEKVYSDFDGLIEMFNNDAYAEKHFDKDFVFIIPEDTSK